MRYETIRVKKPAWVRIVNPDPITIFNTTWRYGDVALTHAGGVLRLLPCGGSRTLALYQAPRLNDDRHECPSDTLLFRTPGDFRLLAEGLGGYEEAWEPRLSESSAAAFAGRVEIGDVGLVPKTRLVRAFFKPVEKAVKDVPVGDPYRDRPRVTRVERRSATLPIRGGGRMTVIAVDGPMLRVLYRASPGRRNEELETGAWFRVPEAEFLRMKEDSIRLKELEDLEQAIVISLLRSL